MIYIYNDNFNENCEDIKINELLLNQSERNLRKKQRSVLLKFLPLYFIMVCTAILHW